MQSLMMPWGSRSDPEIVLARGAAVILTSNLWLETGLRNGDSGIVQNHIFHSDCPHPCLPIAGMYNFHSIQDHPFWNPTNRLYLFHRTYLNGKAKNNNCQLTPPSVNKTGSESLDQTSPRSFFGCLRPGEWQKGMETGLISVFLHKCWWPMRV